VIGVLAAAQRVLCVLYVAAIANVSVAGATTLIDHVTHVGIPSRTAPWGRGSGLGRWMFEMPQQRSVRNYVAFLSENLRPFASTDSIELVTNGTTTVLSNPLALPEEVDESALVRIALDLTILDSEGIEALSNGQGRSNFARIQMRTRSFLR
jgi:hypothetical protein